MTHFDPLMLARIGLALTKTLPTRDGGHVALITSAASHEGKSFVARQVAQALAHTADGDVALVSTSEDEETAAAAQRGSPPHAGLADLIARGRLPEAAFALSEEARLYRVPAGNLALDDSVFSSTGVARAFAALQQRFALSVVDGPVLAACGAMLLEADAVVLVVDSRFASPQAIRREMARAGIEPSRLTGVVLNHAAAGLPAWMGGD